VDIERFAASSLQPIERFDDGRPNVLFVGRLEPRKGLSYLIDAFPRIRAAVPNARLIVAGHYGERVRRRWQRSAELRGLKEADVAFVGYVPPEDLPRYYRSATVFCAPSTGFEALGIVLLEAMASGTPIVTTDIAGYRTVVSPGREALVVPPAQAPRLADAVIELLREPERRRAMGLAGQARARRYAWECVARDLIELYQACLDGAEAPRL
jgi:phosphatidylinositol alpha-mannosyltransferase